jgi:hypothetical protein
VKIPSYWAKAVAERTLPDGTTRAQTSWRSSDVSEEDARQSAQVAAKELLQNMLTRRAEEYAAYGNGPLREEVVERFHNSNGELIAAVTRNKSGALVLNAARVLFVDLDFPITHRREQLAWFVRRIFRSAVPSPEQRREVNAYSAWQSFVDHHSDWSSRVYRTFAGLRVIVTHALFDPCSDSTIQLLQRAGCDPLYVRLCKAQESFRARLTPKPRRCGFWPTPVHWPYETDAIQRRFAEWQT